MLPVTTVLLVKQLNAGVNWLIQNTGLSTAVLRIFSVYFIDVNTGFAASSAGKIIKTTNGGNNWNLIFTISSYAVSRSIFFPRFEYRFCSQVVILPMKLYSEQPTAVVNWVSELLPFTGHANNIFFTSVNEGYISCEGGVIYKTTNGGNPIGIKSISRNYTG